VQTDDPEEKTLKRHFGTWKLDLLHAINSDPHLQPSDVAVALALVKHLSVKTFSAWPSQETLAEITHMSVRNVDKCLKRLRHAGWLQWARGNMQKSNVYSFDEYKVGQEIARMKREDVARKTRRGAVSDLNHSAGQKHRRT
jgi:hypothetical protein